MSTPSQASARRDIAGEISAKILAALAEGVRPWRKPWDSARTHPLPPRRACGEFYRGANTILLWLAGERFASPYWLTFNQALKLGASVRKGERAERVIYYGAAQRRVESKDGADTEQSFRFLKTYAVFNAEQIEGLPERFYPRPAPATPCPLTAHEQWFAKLEIARTLSRDIACYIPSRDLIAMPPLAAFDSALTYAATLNHEAVHATAAPHRVGRDLSKRYASKARAAEELVAEIGAAMLGAHLGLPPDHIFDHAAYIESWMLLLRHHKRAFFHAAAQAQTAVDWLLAKSPALEASHVEA